MTLVYIGIGSNLGDREKNIQRALELLGEHPQIQVLRTSTIHETEPVDMVEADAPKFLNAALEIDTDLSPLDLLSALKHIERTLGRTSPRVASSSAGEQGYRSRTIDLDIVLYGDSVVREPNLVAPHPQMANRGFVLDPLAELCPDLVVPGTGKTVRWLRDRLAGGSSHQP